MQALHGYSRFWLQFLNNRSPAKSYMIAIIRTPETLNLSLIDFAAILEKLMQFENNCVGETLSSVVVLYNCIIIINGLSMHYS